MVTIECEKEIIKASAEKVFIFLSNFDNYKTLMPSSVEEFNSTGDTCSFKIKNMPSIGMAFENNQPNTLVNIVSHGKNPFEYGLKIFIKQLESGETEAYMVLEANVNSFMKMMIEKPLGNFFNYLTHALTKQFS
jgi:carbon monoxide dehydrogenase subunit G